jgi:CRP/FNR family transcriptional regulator
MKELAIFSTLEYEEKEKIGALAGKKVYRKNESIFREGDPADAIYLIKFGRVRLFKVSGEGREITLDILKEDDMFGENTFFDDTLHTMSARALEDTFICSCQKDHFSILLQNAAVSLKIIQLLGKKLNDYTDQVASIAFRDVRGRIAATLLRLAGDYGAASPEGVVINIDLTHQDIGSLVNASRVMVTKILGSLRQEGIIDTRGQRIILLNMDKLSEAMEAV